MEEQNKSLGPKILENYPKNVFVTENLDLKTQAWLETLSKYSNKQTDLKKMREMNSYQDKREFCDNNYKVLDREERINYIKTMQKNELKLKDYFKPAPFALAVLVLLSRAMFYTRL